VGTAVAEAEPAGYGQSFEGQILVENKIGWRAVRIQEASAHDRQPGEFAGGALVEADVELVDTEGVRGGAIQGLGLGDQVRGVAGGDADAGGDRIAQIGIDREARPAAKARPVLADVLEAVETGLGDAAGGVDAVVVEIETGDVVA